MFFRKENLYKKLAVAFAVGAAVGAAVALIYAPMPGRKLQRKLADFTDKAVDMVGDQYDNVQSTVRKLARV